MNYRFQGYPGQNLSEYGIAAALIAVACIVSLVLLGGSIQDALRYFANGIAPNKKEIALAPPDEEPQADPVALQAPETPQAETPPPLTPVQALSKASLDLSAVDYSINMSQAIETAGANGATEMLVTQLRSTANTLLQSGEINQEQYNDMMALANQGHRLGEIAKLIEGAAAKSTSQSEFFKTKVMFDGKSVTIDNLYDMIGNSPGRITGDPLHPSKINSVCPELREFVKLYSKLEQNGTLSNPAVQDIVGNATSQIIWINESLDVSLDQIADKSLSPGAITKNTASMLVNKHSADICHANNGNGKAKGKDNGTKCIQ